MNVDPQDFHGTVPPEQAVYLAQHVNEGAQGTLFGDPVCASLHLDERPRIAVAKVDGEPCCKECTEGLRSQGFEVEAL